MTKTFGVEAVSNGRSKRVNSVTDFLKIKMTTHTQTHTMFQLNAKIFLRNYFFFVFKIFTMVVLLPLTGIFDQNRLCKCVFNYIIFLSSMFANERKKFKNYSGQWFDELFANDTIETIWSFL